MGKRKLTTWTKDVLKSLVHACVCMHSPYIALVFSGAWYLCPSSQSSHDAFIDLRKSFVLDVWLITDAANSSLWKDEVRIFAVPRRRAFLILDFPACAGSTSEAEILLNTLFHAEFSTPACVDRSSWRFIRILDMLLFSLRFSSEVNGYVWVENPGWPRKYPMTEKRRMTIFVTGPRSWKNSDTTTKKFDQTNATTRHGHDPETVQSSSYTHYRLLLDTFWYRLISTNISRYKKPPTNIRNALFLLYFPSIMDLSNKPFNFFYLYCN
jgi:hypothetical protein